MKKKLLLFLGFIAFSTTTQAIGREGENDKNPNFYANPLRLNGHSLDYGSFNLLSRGTLAVVEGNPESDKAVLVPFRAYIKRDGMIVNEGLVPDSREYTSVPVQLILAKAQPGDELVIEPVRKRDSVARRVIKLRHFIWFRFPLVDDRC